MVRKRVIETMEGIQDAFDVASYNRMMRRMWKRGWVETKEVIQSGILQGTALEISPGPGYLGIDWLLRTNATSLVGLDISEEMLRTSRKNARLEGVGDRAHYVHGDACKMPFDADTFDAVFASGGMHEWSNPCAVFDEITRVLKPGGRYCITDLRRDTNVFIRKLLPLTIRERAMRRGFTTSINAAYTPDEIRALIAASPLPAPRVSGNVMGLVISGAKQ